MILSEFSNTETNKLFNSMTKETININEYFDIQPVPFQRFTEGRAKTPKVKKSLSKLRPEHLNVDIAELTESCEYYGKIYSAGSVFILNGNTRKHFWKNKLSDIVPPFVFVTRYKFDSMEEMRKSYDTFDSMDAVERNQEKLYGILCRVHNFTPTCSKLEKGEIVSALNLASYYYDRNLFNQPNIKSDHLAPQVSIYIEEIKAFDAICKNPKAWDQALVCSALIALKIYGTNNKKLLSCLDQIDRRAMNTMENERDGATHIVNEWTKNEKFPQKGTNWEKTGGLKETLAFSLYWIKKYMEDEKLTQIGFNWKSTVETLFTEYHKKNAVPIKLSKLFDISKFEVENEPI
jgi:hypothetical protein